MKENENAMMTATPDKILIFLASDVFILTVFVFSEESASERSWQTVKIFFHVIVLYLI